MKQTPRPGQNWAVSIKIRKLQKWAVDQMSVNITKAESAGKIHHKFEDSVCVLSELPHCKLNFHPFPLNVKFLQ